MAHSERVVSLECRQIYLAPQVRQGLVADSAGEVAAVAGYGDRMAETGLGTVGHP